MAKVDRIATCLWFENGSVEAAEFYVSLFPDSRIVDVSTVGAGPAGPARGAEIRLGQMESGTGG